MIPFMGMFFRPAGTPLTAEDARPIAEAVMERWLSADASTWTEIMRSSVTAMVRTESARGPMLERAMASDRWVVARSMHDLIALDLRPEISRIDVPLRVLYVQGPHVPLSAKQADELFRASFADARAATLERIPDAYHFIMIDEPARFAAEVRSFLEKTRP